MTLATATDYQPYQTRLEEFEVLSRDCPQCGSPMPVLNWRPAEAARRESPPVNVGHLIPLLFGNLGGRICRRCTIRRHIARLRPRAAIQGGGISDPVVEQLRALQRQNAPPADDGPVVGMFDGGPVQVSANAAKILGWSIDEDFASNEARYLQGEQRAVLALLATHGSEATVPRLKVPELARARQLGPLASQSLQNAVSVADGFGSVFSRHLVRGARQRRGAVDDVTIWSELGPQPATLVYAHVDDVDFV